MHRVLIVANQSIGSAELADAIAQRIAGGDCYFHLLVPVPQAPPTAIAVGLASIESAAAALMEMPDLKALAEERLQNGLAWLTAIGADATGEIGPSDAVTSAAQIVTRDAIDEVIVSTLPSRLSKWLHQDLPRKIEKAVSVPVVVVTASRVPS